MTLSQKALEYLGIKDNSRKHKEIIDYYNEYIRPLPRGYKMKYSDSWCMCFVSVVQAQVGVVNPIYECSCLQGMKIAKKQKQIVETPKVDDIVFYDWKNDGSINHVGIITDIQGNTLKVIEGNYCNSVKIRNIDTQNKEIECYARVKTLTPIKPQNNPNIDKLAYDVIKGKYGYGKTRINALGDLYSQVQKRVNEILSYTE